MNFTAGARFGRYEILAPLGSGGMGDVFLASDTELGRKVAIKAIQSDFTSDRQARRLVLQEARAAAGLVHPGIAAIHRGRTRKGAILFNGRFGMIREKKSR